MELDAKGVIPTLDESSEDFVDIANDYISKYKPKLAIINSTIIPGTTKKLFEKSKVPVAHVPVRAKHPNLTIGLKKFVNFIGAVDKESADTEIY